MSDIFDRGTAQRQLHGDMQQCLFTELFAMCVRQIAVVRSNCTRHCFGFISSNGLKGVRCYSVKLDRDTRAITRPRHEN